MSSEPNELGPVGPDKLPYADFREVLSALPNAELLNALDLTLLELEKRLYRYAQTFVPRRCLCRPEPGYKL